MFRIVVKGETTAIDKDAIARLVDSKSGDTALVYLQILQGGPLEDLGLSFESVARAVSKLIGMGLIQDEESPTPSENEEEPIHAESFEELCALTEKRLGISFTAREVTVLRYLNDTLQLPLQVILLLVDWCIFEARERLGSGERPTLAQIRKEGVQWTQEGVKTEERAKEYVEQLERYLAREKHYRELLKIGQRQLAAEEKAYIRAWDAMGFEDAVIALAQKRTMASKNEMNWSYMDGILAHWHRKGLHTLDLIQAGEQVQAGKTSIDQDEKAREDMERIKRLMGKMKEEGI